MIDASWVEETDNGFGFDSLMQEHENESKHHQDITLSSLNILKGFFKRKFYLFLIFEGGTKKLSKAILDEFKDLINVLRKLKCRLYLGLLKHNERIIRLLILITESISMQKALRRLRKSYYLLQSFANLYEADINILDKNQLKKILGVWRGSNLLVFPKIKRRRVPTIKNFKLVRKRIINFNINRLWQIIAQAPENTLFLIYFSYTEVPVQIGFLPSGKKIGRETQEIRNFLFVTPILLIKFSLHNIEKQLRSLRELKSSVLSMFTPLTAFPRFDVKVCEKICYFKEVYKILSRNSNSFSSIVAEKSISQSYIFDFFDELARNFLEFFITYGGREGIDLNISEAFARGDIHIGYQLKNGIEVLPFFLSLEDLRRHMIIIGPSGHGKTTLAKIIIKELKKKFPKIKIWIIDFHGEYTHLINEGFKLISPGSNIAPLAINIFDPQKENPETYAVFLTNLLIEAMRTTLEPLSAQMERFLAMAIFETIKSKHGNPITFIQNLWDLCNQLADNLPSAVQTFHAIINRVRSLFSGVMGKVFWVKSTNINFRELLSQDIILDLSNLVRRGALKRDLALLTNVFLRYAITEILNRYEDDLSLALSNELDYFIIIEEGRYIVPWRRRESANETTTLEDFAVLARKYGIALCTISQSPHTLSEDLLENCGTLFIMGGEPPEIEKIPLDENVLRYLVTMPPREAIVKLSSLPMILHVKIRKEAQQPNMNYFKLLLNKASGFTEKLQRNYEMIKYPFEGVISSILEGKELVEQKPSLESNLIKDTSEIRRIISQMTNKENMKEIIWEIRDFPEKLLNLLDNLETGKSELIEKLVAALCRISNNSQELSIAYLDYLDLKNRIRSFVPKN